MDKILNIKRGGGTPSRVVTGDVLGSLESYLPQKKVIVITDSNVHRHYKSLIERFDHIIIGLGETNKTLHTLQKIYSDLIAMDADRHCFILGMGGGIVTDIAGFAASTYMRGVRFGFVATTLLAQVDASVGGKNGVNVDGYKNMAGVFNQPDFVLCDTGVLRTLPDREFRAGMAEIIKAGIIADPKLFALFTKHAFEDFRTDNDLLTKAITSAVKVKASIVEKDEREAGVRRLLNLGHTIGHAVEKSTADHQHGEAVAIGIVMIAGISEKMGLLEPATAQRIRNVFERMGLPVKTKEDRKKLLKALRHDKKRDDRTIDLVIPYGIGDCRIHNISFDKLERLMG